MANWKQELFFTGTISIMQDEKLPGWFAALLGRPKSTLLWSLALLGASIWGASQVNLEWVPAIELPTITINASWPGTPPQTVERYVTAPIERALKGVADTTSIESISYEGQAFIRLESSAGEKLALHLDETSARVAAIGASLPEGVVVHLDREVPEDLRAEQGFMILQMVGDSPETLRALARDSVAPRLRRLSGISGVVIEGGRELELLITVEPSSLQTHRLSFEHVQERLAQALSNDSFGWLRDGHRSTLLRHQGALSPGGLGELPLAQIAGLDDRSSSIVRLQDVARLDLSTAPVTTLRRIDGQSVVTLVLDRAKGSSLLSVADRVRSEIELIQEGLPWGIEMLIADDYSERVREQLSDLALRGGGGLVAIIVVLVLMLKNIRSSSVVFFSVALSLAAALALLKPFGLTLNLITIAGLALVSGLLVDNAVVVVESLTSQCNRRGHLGFITPDTVARALKSIVLPLLGATLTTMAIFLPLVYLSGELRGLFAPFGALVAVALGVSLVNGFLLIPVLSRVLRLRAFRPKRSQRLLKRGFEIPYALAERYPILTLSLLLLVFGLPMPLLPDQLEEPAGGWETRREQEIAQRYNMTLGSDTIQQLRHYLDSLLGGVLGPFLENVELGKRWNFDSWPELYVHLTLPPGSGIQRANELVSGFEQKALMSESPHRVFTLVSSDRALLRVRFHPTAMDTPEPYRVRHGLIQHALQFAGLEIAISGLVPIGFYSGIGDVSHYVVEIFGPSYDGLTEVAEIFAKRLRQHPRVAAIDIHSGRYGHVPTRETLLLDWRSEATAVTGLSAQNLAVALEPYLFSRHPSLLADLGGSHSNQIRLMMAGSEEQKLADLLERPVPKDTVGGGHLRPGDLGRVRAEQQPVKIERYNQQYKRYIRIYYRGPHRLGRKMLESELADTVLPLGYHLKLPDFSFFTEEKRSEFLSLLLATAGLVYLIMAAVFESWRLPWIVMFSLPLAFIGTALGFLWTGANFAEGAFIGLILLLGVAVNDSILLVDRYRQLRSLRPNASGGILARLAVRGRLRPMWATTLTSIAGMLPLLIFPGNGDFWFGLAVTVVGGLLSSTLLAPVATVAILSINKVGRAYFL